MHDHGDGELGRTIFWGTLTFFPRARKLAALLTVLCFMASGALILVALGTNPSDNGIIIPIGMFFVFGLFGIFALIRAKILGWIYERDDFYGRD